MENGIRTAHVAARNPDSMKEGGTQRYIINYIARKMIHIESIRETHMAHLANYLVDNYRATTSPAAKKETSGVAHGGTSVMIRESMRQYIAQIAKQSSRALRAALDRKNSRMPI